MTESHMTESQMTESQSTASESTEEARPGDETIERTVASAVHIGRLWAVYGLEAGRAALRASSETLRATSEILADISKRIDDRREPTRG